MARPVGIDISHYQGTVDWRKVKASGIKFAGVKATEGLNYVDPYFRRNWPAIYKAGIMVRLPYHFARFNSNPRLQARNYVNAVIAAGGFHKGDFAVLDAEDPDAPLRSGDNVGWIMAWLDEVQQLTGLKPSRIIVYTGAWWWGPRTGYSDAPAKAGHPLWLAAYTDEAKLNWKPWRIWRFWQYTSSGHVEGVNGKVDKNYFNGSYRGLWWLSGRPVKLFKG
jgi:GH25 family lysozyme M1 (1,4-beta-N-acetylmuramidase)